MEAALGFLCFFAGFILLVVIAILVMYLLTLQKALNRVSPRNRLMDPGLVWLMLIPLFNIVWHFFIAVRVPGSLANEFRSRGRDDGGDYGKGIGIAMATLSVVGGLLSNAARMSKNDAMNLISAPISLATLVLFIIFWVKIANYSKELASADGRGFDDREDDYGSDRR